MRVMSETRLNALDVRELAPMAGWCAGQCPNGPCEVGGIGKAEVIGDGRERSMGCSNCVPRAPGACFEPKDLRDYAKSLTEAP